jgi:excisionase family DNA binding protein
VDLAARLRALADALPPHGSVTFTRADLVEMVGECGAGKPEPEQLADLTVPALAAELGRSGSTIRGWLGEGLFPHAYRLQGREWRIPRSDVKAFLTQQQKPPAIDEPEPVSESDDLGSWRTLVPTRRAS